MDRGGVADALLDELWVVNGPLHRLASAASPSAAAAATASASSSSASASNSASTPTSSSAAAPHRSEKHAAAPGEPGLLATALNELRAEVARSFLPPSPEALQKLAHEGALRADAPLEQLLAYTPPPLLVKATSDDGPLRNAGKLVRGSCKFLGRQASSVGEDARPFQHSFVHHAPRREWSGEAARPLVALAELLMTLRERATELLWTVPALEDTLGELHASGAPAPQPHHQPPLSAARACALSLFLIRPLPWRAASPPLHLRPRDREHPSLSLGPTESTH